MPQTSRPYNFSTNNYQRGGFITIQENCFAYMATNIGDTIVRVNGMVLFPSAAPATIIGDSITICGHEGDIFKGQLKVEFNPGGAAPNLEIVQLFYLTDNFIKNVG